METPKVVSHLRDGRKRGVISSASTLLAVINASVF
jgi:hypothetical protein